MRRTMPSLILHHDTMSSLSGKVRAVQMRYARIGDALKQELTV